MEVEEKTPAKEFTKQKVNSYVREELKSFTASRLLKFEKRIQDRYTQSGREVPHTISEATMMVFREFERICDKYITMFELYCDKNVLVPRFPESHVTPQTAFSEEEKELDRKLAKRKHELLECRRKKNILQLQQSLIDSEFGQALRRLGALADSISISQLQEDINTLRTSETICDEVRQLAVSLQGEEGEMEEETPEWKEESGPVNMEMMEGLMKCFDSAGLFCLSLWNKQPTISY